MACDDRVDYPAVVSPADGPSVGDGINWDGEKWVTGPGTGGAVTFTGLIDTPSDYVDDAEKYVTVKSTEDGLEFSTVSPGVGEANTSSNQGVGEGLAMSKSGVDLPFKTLTAGSNVTITAGVDTIEIDAATTSSSILDIKVITASSYTLVIEDQEDVMIIMDNENANTVIIPWNSSVDFKVGTQIVIMQKGQGFTSVEPVHSGVNIETSATNTCRAVNSTLAIVQISVNNWVIMGDVETQI